MSIAKPQTVTIVDTLSQGFTLVNRRLWVVIIPLLLNIYLWYGAQVSFRPLVENFIGFVQRSQAEEVYGDALPAVYDSWRELGNNDIVPELAVLNFVPTLATYTVSSLDNTGVTTLPRKVSPSIRDQQAAFYIGDLSIAALLFLLINVLLIPISAAFLAAVAGVTQDGPQSMLGWLRSTGRISMSLTGYAAILVAAIILLGLPTLVVSTVLMFISPAFGLLIGTFVVIITFWARIYIGFAPEAMALHSFDPLVALRASFDVVRRHFWGTLGFLLISSIITIGLGLLWSLVIQSEVGLIVAIIVSAYIGSGLAAARMVFFRDRLQRLPVAKVIRR